MCGLGRDIPLDGEHEQRLSYAKLSRRQERSLVFHLLYAAQAHEYQESLQALADMLSRGYNIEIPFDSQAFSTADMIIKLKDKLDTHIVPFLHNWRFERLGVCTKLILRYAMWEIHYTDMPTTVIINEAIELAKCFSEKDAYKFINGILDEALKARDAQADAGDKAADA